MESNLSSVISKVQKLLALSKSSSAEEAAIANKLIDQYRLSAADLSEDSAEVDPMMEDSSSIYETGRIVS